MAAPDVIGPLMSAILTCADEQLTTRGRTAARTLLAPGAEVAWDDCCDGFLYVRLASMYPTAGQSAPFPQQDTRPGNCKPTMMASVLGVGVLRCAATISSTGKAPTADVLTAETLGMTADAAILLEAIKCCVAPLTDDQDSNALSMVLGTWTPLGPEGCTGGEWSVTIGHGTCPCPEG